MVDLPRSAAARTARLAALPMGYAGRKAIGLGKRIGGKPAELVLTEIQLRTAEQLFRTLGELKGGAMKVGQALSVFEAAMPAELVAPYREQLTRLQDSAPAMPFATVRTILQTELGADWQQQLVEIDPEPAAAASIGQVHRGRWHDGREVAVKVQYPGAGDALRADLRQLALMSRVLVPLFPGLDMKQFIAELRERTEEELDYALEAQAQQAFATAYAGDPDFVVPAVVNASGTVLVSEWVSSPFSLAVVAESGTQAERDRYGELLMRFLLSGPARAGALHADPHPGNFRALPGVDAPHRLAVLDFGAVSRLPDGLPAQIGRLLRACLDGDSVALLEGLRAEGFVRENIRIDAETLMNYLAPFIEAAGVERFRFTREWLREQSARVVNPRDPGFTIATRLNLPASYLLIHRTFSGATGLLCQLEAEVPFRGLLEELLPGFA